MAQIEPKLNRLVWREFDFDDLDIEALRLLTQHGLGDFAQLNHLVKNKVATCKSRLKDLEEIQELLNNKA